MQVFKRWLWWVLCAGVFAAVLPYLIPLPGRELPPKKSPFANGRFSDACGLRWHLQRWSPPSGSAKARVVLLHGFAGSTFSWRLTGPSLAEAGYEVLAVDMPPYGYSDRGTPELALPACLATIVGDEAGELPVVAIGHSMGASVAAHLAAELGQRAAGVVLVDGGLQGRLSSSSAARRWLFALPPVGRWAEVIAHHWMLDPERFARTLASAYGREPTEAEVDGYRTPLLFAGTAARVLAGAQRPPALDPSALPAQQLLLWGREDRWVPAASAEHTAAELPTARLEWIETAGHNPMETHPREFMAIVLAFLAEAVEEAPRATELAP